MTRLLLPLWLASLATATAYEFPSQNSTKSLRRHLQQSVMPPNTLFGYQQGSANAHSDAGGMIYDYKTNQVILTGTTHDNQFWADNGANGVDCFVATIKLPSVKEEQLAIEMSKETPTRVNWELSGKHRIATPNTLDRCDLITTLTGDHDHTFIGGTLAVNQNNNRDATAVQPLLYETTLKDIGRSTQITTGPPLRVFASAPFGQTQGGESLGIPKKNDIIIPAQMTAYNHELYVATVHRILVLQEHEVGSSTAQPKLQISLGIAKFRAVDNTTDSGATATLNKEWSHIEPTTILEVKADEVPHVTSGMFHAAPGLSPKEKEQFELEQHEIEQEINEIEGEEEEYEQEQMQLDMYRHQYKNDGVLISGLEFVQTSDTESFILIAGSAPGTVKDQQGQHNNHTNAGNHPFMPLAPGYTSTIGDWDGYVAKLDARTGLTAMQMNLGINTWGYRLHTQSHRNDFIQSICVPKLPEGMPLGMNLFPQVVYAVGTTQGKLQGDQYGGAFIIQLDLASMDITWKQQIPGMNVHGMSCQVLVDAASHGQQIRAESRDLIYIAGEVHGQMKVAMADGTTVTTHGHGETDVWVAQLRASDGLVNWVQQVGSTEQDRLAKNINNPQVAIGETNTLGETGGGKGAMVLDREGNAIIYGTTNGSLGRTKGAGDRNRDIFVVRLHRDDGSYKALVEPPKTPIGSGGGLSGSSSNGNLQSSTSQATHGGATKDATSVNVGIIIAWFAVPLVLGALIIATTIGGGDNRELKPSEPTGAADLHVDFPGSPSHDIDPVSPPSHSFPPGVEQSLEMSPTKSQPTTEHYGVL